MESDADIVLGRGKKRVRDPNSWKCNVRKQKRLKGEEYTANKGKVIPKKSVVRPICR